MKNCKLCGKNLKEYGIGFTQTEIRNYHVYLDRSNKYLEYEAADEISDDGNGIFFCCYCGSSLDKLKEQDIINILKKIKKVKENNFSKFCKSKNFRYT